MTHSANSYVLFPRQPEKGTFHVALVIPQCLRGETSRDLVEVSEFLADRAVARRDQLERLVQGLRDLAKRCRPVPPGLLGKLIGRDDHPDRIGEGGFDQDWGAITAHAGLGKERQADPQPSGCFFRGQEGFPRCRAHIGSWVTVIHLLMPQTQRFD